MFASSSRRSRGRRKAPVMANRTLGVLSRMFNFALDREWIEASPAARIPEPGEEQSRDRVLSDDELRELWERLETIAKQSDAVDQESESDDDKRVPQITRATAQAFQVQLLTAQRPGEVRSMTWADVDLEAGWWSIPATVAKNGRPHRVPLTATRRSRFSKERLTNAGEERHVRVRESSWLGSVAHRGKKAASMLCRSLTFQFRAHDLRRTAATRMAEAGVPRDHIAKVLNHVETAQQPRASTTATTTTPRSARLSNAGPAGFKPSLRARPRKSCRCAADSEE